MVWPITTPILTASRCWGSCLQTCENSAPRICRCSTWASMVRTPLIFSLWTKKISDRLHKRWREESLPDLTDAIQTGSPTARSFAAGYILHHMLDDTVHPVIYGWMEEGSSHFPAGDRFGFASPGRKSPGQFPQAAHRGKGAHRSHGRNLCSSPWGPGSIWPVSGAWPHSATVSAGPPARDRRHPRPGKGTGP